jgi:hypothetical protein
MISENLVLLIMCFSLFVIYKKVNKWENAESFSKNITPTPAKNQQPQQHQQPQSDSISDIISGTLKNIFLSPSSPPKVAPRQKLTIQEPDLKYTLESNKFHTDFRDVITAFNSISENKKVFNLDHDGVEQVLLTKVLAEPIVLQFILDVNENIMKNGTSLHRNSGWDDCLPRKNVESGWDKVQKSLGLPTSLYDEPALNSSFEMVTILEALLFKTVDQSKYLITFVGRKKNVQDRILIKLSVVYYNDRNKKIFKIYEDIDIIGFFVVNDQTSFDPANDFDQIGYDFKDLSQTDAIDNRFISFELQKKYKNRLREIGNRISKMDTNVQDVYLS